MISAPIMAVTLFTLLGGGPGHGQDAKASILGTVVSARTLEPVGGVRVLLRRRIDGEGLQFDTTFATDSDQAGRFRFEKLHAGRYLIEASFETDTLRATPLELARAERLLVELTVGRVEGMILPDLRVDEAGPRPNARTDEVTRRLAAARLTGQVITREMIEARNAPTFVDVLRMATGIEVRCRMSQCLPRMVRAPVGCPGPQVVLDGAGTDVRVLLAVRPEEVEGVEIYNGLAEAPFELVRDPKLARCGVIVVWTRGGPGRRPPDNPSS